MPVHDWTRVEPGIFHDFHNAWVTELGNALNGGILPSHYYALIEQHAGRFVPDLLTLHAEPLSEAAPLPEPGGGLALAEAPPKVRRKLTATGAYRRLRRSLAIRHVSGHRLVGLVEIVSPSNKDRPQSVTDFVSKVVTALEHRVHVVLIDLFPPGRFDPRGMHAAVWDFFDSEAYELPANEPLSLASYEADEPPDAYVEHAAVGAQLPDMPLFLGWDRYVDVPLERTYHAAYQGRPVFWREVVEGRRPAGN
jgi:hypothetical protein